MRDFNGSTQFKNVVTALFRIGSLDKECAQLGMVYLYNWGANINRYFGGNKEEYNRFFSELTSDKDIDIRIRSSLVYNFIEDFINKKITNETSFISQEDLQERALTIFEEYLNSINMKYNGEMQSFYRSNYYEVNEQIITYSDKTNKLYLKYLKTNHLVFNNYLKMLWCQASGHIMEV